MIKLTNNNETVTISNIRFASFNMSRIITNGKVLWQRIKEAVLGVFNSGRWISNNIWNASEIWKNN